MNDSKTSNDSGKSKHKKKVSFSFFEISTFDELAKLRKMREEELEDFVSNKKKTNQYLTNLNQRNQILSMSNADLISFDNNEKNNINNNMSRNIHLMKNMNNNILGIPKPVRKEENSGNDSYFYNQENIMDAFKNKMSLNKKIKKVAFSSDEEEDIKSNEIISSPPQITSVDKNEIINDINNIKSPTNNKDNNILSKESNFSPNDNNIQEIINEPNNIIFTENNEDKEKNKYNNININENNLEQNDKKDNIDEINENINNISESENNNINHKDKLENNENEIENKNLEQNEDNNNIISNNFDNINNKEDNNNDKELIEDNNSKKLELNVTTLFNLLEKIFQISPMNKLKLIHQFFTNLLSFIEYQIDQYLDYESNDSKFLEEIENKSRLIHLKVYYNSFINNTKEKIAKKKLYNEHKIKARKYAQYINYKYKAYAFNNLLTFSIKQKEWIKSIRAAFMKKLVWECVENLKIYRNYRMAKNYLRLRKKKIIFDKLKNNKQLSIQLLKNGRKLSLIFEYRHFFNNCRKKILAQKGKEINDKLVQEFRNQYLLRRVFNLIKKNHDIRKEKKNLYNNMVINRNQKGKDFINIKVTRKETIKYQNGSTLMRIQNKINAV